MDFRHLDSAKRAALSKQLDTVGERWLHDRTVCVFIKTKTGNPIAHGSGVLLQIADAHFLLSAGHVLVNTEKHRTDIVMIAPDAGGGPGLIPLMGTRIARTEDLDEADFGFARLPKHVLDLVSPCKKFVRLSEVAHETVPTGECYSVMGFPQEWARIDHETRRLSLQRLCYTTTLLNEPPAFSMSEASLALALGKDIEPLNNVARRMPNFRGMSGCGIWRMYGPESSMRLRSWSTSFIRLAGIEHTVHGTQAIRGMMLPYILETIVHGYPELRSAVEIARNAAALDAQPRVVLPSRGRKKDGNRRR